MILVNLFRWLMLIIDHLLYSLVSVFYNLFMAISEIRLFSDGGSSSLISIISTRIYALIGVYALFKVTFILINMLINPDSVNDKQKGAGKLIVRIVVMLCLIIAVPWVFEMAYELQRIVLKENIIGTILLGDEGNPDSEIVKNAGQTTANDIFASFITIDPLAVDNPNVDPDKINVTAPACNDGFEALKKIKTGGIASIYAHINTQFSTSNGNEYCLNFNFIASLLAGGFAAYVFAVYCIDIGLRVAKLAFYEITAPVSIVTYVDGKKDGPFNNWVKSTISAYADLFLRLIIIYFIILMINSGLPSLLKIEALQKYDVITRNFAKGVVIIGLLMFATQAPKLIKDLFGIKGDGSDMGFSLGKKFAAAPAAAAAVGLMTAGASKVAATAGNKGLQIAANLRDKAKFGGGSAEYAAAKKTNDENYRIRQKAASVQALSMLDRKNYDSKTNKYTGVKGRDLAAQTITGDSNVKGGLFSKFSPTNMQDTLMRDLSYKTRDQEKTPGVKRATGNSINAGYRVGNMQNALDIIRERVNKGLTSADQLQTNSDGNFNAKNLYVAATGTDKSYIESYQDDITDAAGVTRNYYQNIYDDAGNLIRATTAAEKLAIDKYAKDVADKELEHEKLLMSKKK